MQKKHTLVWFLVGLGSQLQIVASLSFTELFALIAAPFIFLKECQNMKRVGITPLFTLSLLVVVGCAIACYLNDSETWAMIRGMATVCLLPCLIVLSYWLLRQNMNGFKWMLVGLCISSILCTFIFQKSVEVTVAGGYGSVGASDITSAPLYWVKRLKDLFYLPSSGWYLKCPLLYSVFMPLCMAVYALLTTGGTGRAFALTCIAGSVLILVGRKKMESMRLISLKFYFWVLMGLICVIVITKGYSYAARNNYLGDKARQKYENQTKGSDSLGAIIMGGRMDSFCGLLAALDKPIIGFGPWAIDKNGYAQEFLFKFGNIEDYENYVKTEEFNLSRGFSYRLIPCHSYISTFWVSYGIFGLVFWLYAAWLVIRFIRYDSWVVPQWYMWLVVSTPVFFWDLFFSPFAARFETMLFLVACLYARAVRLRRAQMPEEMIIEIERNESK